jgi:soluble P-type ATPase
MKFEIPNKESFVINTIILDLNGTIAVKGKIIKGVKKRIKKLRNLNYQLILISGDHRENAKNIAKRLGIDYIVTQNKEKEMQKVYKEHCASIGNARIDIGTFKHVKLSILVIEGEGIHVKTIPFADIITKSINDALDLFIDKDSLIATMK